MTYHILSKCGSSLHYGQACAFSDFQQDQMTCCIGHNCKPFLCCGLPCASSEFLLDQMTSHILNKCGSSLHCGWACAFSDVMFDQMTSGIGHNCRPLRWCGLQCACSDLLSDQMTSYNVNKRSSLLHCGFANTLPRYFGGCTTHSGMCWTVRSKHFPLKCTDVEILGFDFTLLLFDVSSQLSIEWSGTFSDKRLWCLHIL